MEDFISNYKNEYSQKTQNAQEKESKEWDNSSLMNEYFTNYNKALKKRGEKSISYEDFTKKISDMVGRMGVVDGKWTQKEYEDGAYYDKDNYQNYKNEFLTAAIGGVSPWRGGLDSEIGEYAPQDVKEAYERLKKYNNEQWGAEAIFDRANERAKDDTNIIESAGTAFGNIFDAIGSGMATVWNSPYNLGQKEVDQQTIDKYRKQMSDTAIAMFDDFDTYYEEYKKNKPKQEAAKKAESGNGVEAKGNNNSNSGTNTSSDETTDEEVTFTLKSANDPNYKGFGQKIVDLGLATDKGLWGNDGDVQFYTKQLYEQGAIDKNGNLKIGVPIRLRKRKITK